MLSVRQLNKFIDSLEKTTRRTEKKTRQDVRPYLELTKYLDTVWPKTSAEKTTAKSISNIVPDSLKSIIFEQSHSYVNSTKSAMDVAATEFNSQRKELRLYLIEWHTKFTMSIAVLVLFLIGAPLGSIVRKGGIGTPVVFAVIFFVIFFLLNNFGKKFVREDVLQPVSGIWLATMVLVPIGIFLIYKAMHDSQLFNKESYFRAFRRMRGMFTSRQ